MTKKNNLTGQIQVSSEIGTLKRVIVHRPDAGISRISPRKAEELLFDDIVHLPLMQKEHDVFTDILKAFLGEENVLYTEQLLIEALAHDEALKLEMIELIGDYEELPKAYKEILIHLAPETLANVLITGYYPEEDFFLFDPIPNFIFTRDIAVTVNDHVIITKAAKEARHRENYLTRFIFSAHPIFSNLKKKGHIINLNHVDNFPPSRKGETVSVEGGDMMIINQDYLLIGRSERTTEHAVHSVRDVLFEKGVIKNVVQVSIPSERSFMHIDTIFTQIHHNHITAYKPIVYDGMGSNVIVYRSNGAMTSYASVKEFFASEINANMEFIFSGNGESPYQEREQWTDGCNLVTLKPGVALTYDRNPHTEIAFKEKGYNIIHAKELLEQFTSGKVKPSDVENTIIALPSTELSRARGGAHCMTCPIERA